MSKLCVSGLLKAAAHNQTKRKLSATVICEVALILGATLARALRRRLRPEIGSSDAVASLAAPILKLAPLW
jgi:hypothetical protein